MGFIFNFVGIVVLSFLVNTAIVTRQEFSRRLTQLTSRVFGP